MPMCVENVPVSVRKKKCVPKRIALSIRISAIVFMYVVYETTM